MRKIAFMLLCSLPLFADFFPQTVHTAIISTQDKTVKLAKPFPAVGMSGVVVHNYDNNLTAITAHIVQTSMDGSATILETNILEHDAIPSIQTTLTNKDKVIGGYLYDNVLLLTPDADTYAKIVASENKKWIHPDLYAVYLSSKSEESVNKENLADFAKKYQVGLVYIVRKNTAILFDPISGKIVSQKAISNTPKKGQFPFFMRLEPLKSGWFGSGEVSGDYYNAMEKL